MQQTSQSLGGKSISTLGLRVQAIVDEGLPKILPARQSEFDDRFQRDGDMAYGALNKELFQPVRQLLSDLGMKAQPALPGDFQESREWGNADETHQQRWMWSLILSSSDKAIGGLAVGVHHDHTQFRLPRSPEIVGLNSTTWIAAEHELECRLPAFAREQSFREWYSAYERSTGKA